MLREIQRLPEAEVIRQWAELYAAGKHAGKAKPNLDQYLGRDPTWVLVEIPHDLYTADWNDPDGFGLSSSQLKRAERYALQEGRLPPGMASFRGRRRRALAFVSDGNHRAYAAYLRGPDCSVLHAARRLGAFPLRGRIEHVGLGVRATAAASWHSPPRHKLSPRSRRSRTTTTAT